MAPAILEVDTGAGDQLLDLAGDEDVVGSDRLADAPGVTTPTGRVVSAKLHLAGVDAL